MAMVHPYKGLNRIRVPPDVVKSGLIRAAEMRQGLKKPLFTAINGGRDVFALGLQFQQRCQAQRRSPRSECVVCAGNRRKDVQVFRTFRAPPGAVGILVFQQERYAAIHRLLQFGLFGHFGCWKSRRDQETIGFLEPCQQARGLRGKRTATRISWLLLCRFFQEDFFSRFESFQDLGFVSDPLAQAHGSLSHVCLRLPSHTQSLCRPRRGKRLPAAPPAPWVCRTPRELLSKSFRVRPANPPAGLADATGNQTRRARWGRTKCWRPARRVGVREHPSVRPDALKPDLILGRSFSATSKRISSGCSVTIVMMVWLGVKLRPAATSRQISLHPATCHAHTVRSRPYRQRARRSSWLPRHVAGQSASHPPVSGPAAVW